MAHPEEINKVAKVQTQARRGVAFFKGGSLPTRVRTRCRR